MQISALARQWQKFRRPDSVNYADDAATCEKGGGVVAASKQSREGSGNVSYLYGLKRANGQAKEGRYH
jgi:hypothetical protein